MQDFGVADHFEGRNGRVGLLDGPWCEEQMIQYHQDECFFVVASEAGIQAIRDLVVHTNGSIHVWHLQPKLLELGAEYLNINDDFLDQFPAVDERRYRSFWDEHLANREELDRDKLRTMRALHWLAANAGRAGYWFHCGDNGLIYEYAIGTGDDSLLMFNELESPRGYSDQPASALTAVLRYLGTEVPNRSERYWSHGGLMDYRRP